MGRPPKIPKKPRPVEAEWLTACPDWRERIMHGRSLMPKLPLDAQEADKAVRTFDLLRLPDVPGNPMLREACGEWFREIVRALFGAFDPVSGVRHINEVFVLVPKKNSKTTYSAALMLTAMFRNRRPRAEFLLIAPTQEVADLAYQQAVGMVALDPVLSAACHVQEHIKRIAFRPTGAFLKIKSFDARVVTGTKPAGVLVDETHVIANAHDADRVIGQLRGGLISQPEGFLVQITTQGERAPSGVFKSELQKARDVRDGRLRAAVLPVIYEFPPEVPWRDTKLWPLVLPNLGRSVSLPRLIADYQSADSSGPEELRRWASQHLNVEIGLALLSDAWAGADYWTAQADKTLTLETLLQRSEVVTVGIDGGGLDDLLGFCALGRDAENGKWLAWCRAWAHPIVLERRKSEAPKIRDFAKDGDLVLVATIGQDVAEVAEIVARIEESGLLDKVGVDPVGIGAIVDAIEARGIPQDRIVGINQGWRLTGAIKTTERRLAEGALMHSGAPMMQWCVGNARVEPRGNAIAITKQAAGTAKIDPLMAMFNAVSLMQLNPAGGAGSYMDFVESRAAA